MHESHPSTLIEKDCDMIEVKRKDKYIKNKGLKALKQILFQ